MTKTTFAADPKFWYYLTVNVLNSYLGDYDQETMENVAVELLVGCQDDGSVSYDTVVRVAQAIDPEIVDNDEEFGHFAWLLDSAIDFFSAKAKANAINYEAWYGK